MAKKIKILGFGGSLRAESYNETVLHCSALLEATKELCPKDAEVEIFDRLHEFPLYNQDLEAKMPEVVADFKKKIEAADAILIVTPEYDYSIPGFLKNAIDWASRPFGYNSFNNKPAALMSASTGMLGGARAQYALRQSAVFLNLHLINKPEVFVANAQDKIRDGKIIDQFTKDKITELLIELCKWTRRIS